MDQVIKTFLGFIILILLSFVGIGIINTANQAKSADEFLDSCVNRIETSNFSTKVIADCQADIPDGKDYVLTVDVNTSSGNSNVAYGTATLKYKYKVVLIGLETTQTIKKDIR